MSAASSANVVDGVHRGNVGLITLASILKDLGSPPSGETLAVCKIMMIAMNTDHIGTKTDLMVEVTAAVTVVEIDMGMTDRVVVGVMVARTSLAAYNFRATGWAAATVSHFSFIFSDDFPATSTPLYNLWKIQS